MKRLSYFSYFAPVLAIVGAGIFACSSTTTSYVDVPDETPAKDAGFDSQPSAESGLGILSFMPNKTYTGFDGTHTFRVPLAVYDSGDDLEVTSTTPSAVDIVPKKLTNPVRPDGTTDSGKYFIVTVKQAGTITLQATSNGETVEAKIVVTEYADGRWAAGEARYMTGPNTENPPCTNCHVSGKAIDHSPAALASSNDSEVQAIITSGLINNHPIKVDGYPAHTWQATPDELAGLVTYLRALEPKGFK